MSKVVYENEKVVYIPSEKTVQEQTQIHTVGTESSKVEIRQVSSGFGERNSIKIQMAA